MANLFFWSDNHFGHENLYRFTDKDGNRVRAKFTCAEEADEYMVDAYNKTVKPSDHCYFLGDVAMAKRGLPICKRLNGHKRLIFGNHDIYDYQEYVAVGFKKLMAYRVLDGMIFSHIPVSEGSLERFKVNVHGHLHANVVTFEQTHPGWPMGRQPDRRYLNVCVEHTDYTPISLEAIKSIVAKCQSQ